MHGDEEKEKRKGAALEQLRRVDVLLYRGGIQVFHELYSTYKLAVEKGESLKWGHSFALSTYNEPGEISRATRLRLDGTLDRSQE